MASTIKRIPEPTVIKKTSFKLNSHGNLVDTEMGGNGYHGRCEHCGLACVTDLGYYSWEGTTCVDREPKYLGDFPEDIISYVNFNGLMFKPEKQLFTKAYSNVKYTYAQLRKIIDQLKSKY